MAGLTHSAFRRLISDFGGAGGLFTEMLCGRWILREDVDHSPALRRRPQEGPVIYQLMLADPADVPRIVARLAGLGPAGLDLNCACPAPHIRQVGAGSELFEDAPRLRAILEALRREWTGLLTVKIRLGRPRPEWWGRFVERLRLIEDLGVDAVTVHPRFADEKLRRRARVELFPQTVAATRLPVIASGDLQGPEVVRAHASSLAGVRGIMVGRMAVVKPWLFRGWDDPAFAPDFREVWMRFVGYAREDFPAQKVFHRVRAFTAYYSRNFHFGHSLFRIAQSAASLEELESRALGFLEGAPQPALQPDVAGLA